MLPILQEVFPVGLSFQVRLGGFLTNIYFMSQVHCESFDNNFVALQQSPTLFAVIQID